MSASSRGPGRPPKPDPETLQRRREFLLLHENKVRVEDIAQKYKLALSRVWEIIRDARADAAAVEALNQPPPDPAAEPQPVQPRRLSRRIAQSRAWDIADRRPNFSLGLGANSLWVRTIVAIHEEGDGFRLHIGEPGARFRSRDDLAVLLLGHLERRDVNVSGWLTALFEHGRLIDIDSVDIGIPRGLGLIPGENSRGEPLKVAPVKPARTAQAPLPFKPMVVTGGLSDSGNIAPSDSGSIGIFPESDSGNIATDDSGNIPISPESVAPGRVAAAAAKDERNQPFSSSSSNQGRAGDSGRIGNIPGVDSGEIPTHDSDKLSQQSLLAALTVGLMLLARITRAPNADDLGAVRGWLDAGYAADGMRGVIEAKMIQRGAKPPPTSLVYFNGPMREALGSKPSPAATVISIAAPAPALSEPEIEEPILGNGLDAQYARAARALRAQIGAGTYRTWLFKAKLVGIDDDGEITVSLPSAFDRDQVRDKFRTQFTAALKAENPKIERVEFVAAPERKEAAD